MTAIKEPLSAPPNTSTGDNAHFQKGIPAPGTTKVNPYVATIITNITNNAVINDLAPTFKPFFSCCSTFTLNTSTLQ